MSKWCCYKSQKNSIKIIIKTKINMSAELNKHHNEYVPENKDTVKSAYDTLLAIWITDESLREQTLARVNNILWKYDVGEDYICDWLASNMKLRNGLWELSDKYTRSFRSILESATNNPDESLVA